MDRDRGRRTRVGKAARCRPRPPARPQVLARRRLARPRLPVRLRPSARLQLARPRTRHELQRGQARLKRPPPPIQQQRRAGRLFDRHDAYRSNAPRNRPITGSEPAGATAASDISHASRTALRLRTGECASARRRYPVRGVLAGLGFRERRALARLLDRRRPRGEAALLLPTVREAGVRSPLTPAPALHSQRGAAPQTLHSQPGEE